jgi:hypothetical protein
VSATRPLEAALYSDLAEPSEPLVDQLRLALRVLYTLLLKGDHSLQLGKVLFEAERHELRETLEKSRAITDGVRHETEGDKRVRLRVEQLKRDRGIPDDPLGIDVLPVDKSP